MKQEDFFTQMSAEQALAEQKLIATRAILGAELRTACITRAWIYYEGYDDDGNVEEIQLEPSNISLPDSLRRRLEDFGWDFAYSYNPGLEVDSGGGGELAWDLLNDVIDLSYSRYGDGEGILEEYKDQ